MAALADTMPADSAWLLAASTLTMVMTPGLAFFYGGLVSDNSIVSTLMLNFGTMGVVTLLWGVLGFSIAFGPSVGAGFIGDPMGAIIPAAPNDAVDPGSVPRATGITDSTFLLFTGCFAVVTAAIISGVAVQRMKYTWFLCFVGLWHILIYAPLARAVFHPEGFLVKLGSIDFAGGLVVHTASGMSALTLAFWLQRHQARQAGREGSTGGTSALASSASALAADLRNVPHSVPLTMLGAALLWFGWFGFNAGSALRADASAGRAMVCTNFSAAAGMLTWGFLERVYGKEGWGAGRPTAVGAACGAVTGLVAITPAAAFVSRLWAVFIGFITVVVVFFQPALIRRIGVRDRLDCYAIHGAGGVTGSILAGLFASVAAGAKVDGAFFGQPMLVVYQLASVAFTIGYCVVGTTIIFGVLRVCAWALRTDVALSGDEDADTSQHGERAYYSSTEKWTDEGLSLQSGGGGVLALMHAIQLQHHHQHHQAAGHGGSGGMRPVSSQCTSPCSVSSATSSAAAVASAVVANGSGRNGSDTGGAGASSLGAGSGARMRLRAGNGLLPHFYSQQYHHHHQQQPSALMHDSTVDGSSTAYNQHHDVDQHIDPHLQGVHQRQQLQGDEEEGGSQPGYRPHRLVTGYSPHHHHHHHHQQQQPVDPRDPSSPTSSSTPTVRRVVRPEQQHHHHQPQPRQQLRSFYASGGSGGDDDSLGIMTTGTAASAVVAADDLDLGGGMDTGAASVTVATAAETAPAWTEYDFSGTGGAGVRGSDSPVVGAAARHVALPMHMHMHHGYHVHYAGAAAAPPVLVRLPVAAPLHPPPLAGAAGMAIATAADALLDGGGLASLDSPVSPPGGMRRASGMVVELASVHGADGTGGAFNDPTNPDTGATPQQRRRWPTTSTADSSVHSDGAPAGHGHAHHRGGGGGGGGGVVVVPEALEAPFALAPRTNAGARTRAPPHHLQHQQQVVVVGVAPVATAAAAWAAAAGAAGAATGGAAAAGGRSPARLRIGTASPMAATGGGSGALGGPLRRGGMGAEVGMAATTDSNRLDDEEEEEEEQGAAAHGGRVVAAGAAAAAGTGDLHDGGDDDGTGGERRGSIPGDAGSSR